VPSREVHVKPLVEHLSFVTSKSRWRAAFRFGLVQLPARDFGLIAERMGAPSLVEVELISCASSAEVTFVHLFFAGTLAGIEITLRA
jgi:hypothetical protein